MVMVVVGNAMVVMILVIRVVMWRWWCIGEKRSGSESRGGRGQTCSWWFQGQYLVLVLLMVIVMVVMVLMVMVMEVMMVVKVMKKSVIPEL